MHAQLNENKDLKARFRDFGDSNADLSVTSKQSIDFTAEYSAGMPYRVSAEQIDKPTMVAYIRYEGDLRNAGAKLIQIQDYCSEHDFKLVKAFEEQGRLSTGLYRALKALEDTDGLITVTLEDFVEQDGDQMRDLRPLMEEYFSLANKRLITLEQGVNKTAPASLMSASNSIDQA